jgi:hypothetical protein
VPCGLSWLFSKLRSALWRRRGGQLPKGCSAAEDGGSRACWLWGMAVRSGEEGRRHRCGPEAGPARDPSSRQPPRLLRGTVASRTTRIGAARGKRRPLVRSPQAQGRETRADHEQASPLSVAGSGLPRREIRYRSVRIEAWGLIAPPVFAGYRSQSKDRSWRALNARNRRAPLTDPAPSRRT